MRISFKNTVHEGQEVGEIIVRDFAEEFLASIGSWGKPDYIKHWLNRTISALSGNNVCFITDWRGPKEPALAESIKYDAERVWGQMWTLHWIGPNDAVLQNRLIIQDHLPPHPNEMDAEERQIEDEDGNEILGWSVSRSELEDFKVHLKCELDGGDH